MSVISNLTVVLAADTASFEAGMKTAAQRAKAWQKTAVDLFTATQTPAERHRAAMLRVSDAYARGTISLRTHDRALQQLRDEYYQASGGAAKLKAQLDAINASAVRGQGAMSALGGGLKRLGSTTVPMIPGFGLLSGALSGYALVAGAKASYSLAESFEATSISMEVLMKDSVGAKKLIEDLYQYAAHTPFEFPDVAEAGKQLLGYGEDAKQIMPDIRMLGNIASGLNIPLTELANVFGRNRNQLHLYTRDINELANRGVPVIQALAKRFNVATTAVKDLVESGKVGFEDLRAALESMSAAGGQFEGMTDRLGKSMLGIRSTAIDDVKSAMRELGKVIGAEVLPQIAAAAHGIAELAQHLGKPAGDTDLGKRLAENQARMAQATTPQSSQTGNAQLEALDAQIKSAIDRQREIGERVSSSFLGAAPIFAVGQIQEANALNTHINELMRERMALQRQAALLQQQELDTGRAVNDFLGDAVGKAGSLIRAGKETAAAWSAAAESGLKRFREQMEGLKETAKKMAKDAQAAKAVIAATRTPQEKYRDEAREIERLHKAGAIGDSTRDRALQQARQRREQAETSHPEAQRMRQMADEANRLKNDLMTPLDKYEAEIKHLQELAAQSDEKGHFILGEGDLAKAKRAAYDRARQDLGAPEHEQRSQSSENKALLAGSAEAYQAMNRANDLKRITALEQQQLDVHRKQLAALEKLAAANGGGGEGGGGGGEGGGGGGGGRGGGKRPPRQAPPPRQPPPRLNPRQRREQVQERARQAAERAGRTPRPKPSNSGNFDIPPDPRRAPAAAPPPAPRPTPRAPAGGAPDPRPPRPSTPAPSPGEKEVAKILQQQLTIQQRQEILQRTIASAMTSFKVWS